MRDELELASSNASKVTSRLTITRRRPRLRRYIYIVYILGECRALWGERERVHTLALAGRPAVHVHACMAHIACAGVHVRVLGVALNHVDTFALHIDSRSS